jgi:uncharacterized membrane protein
MRGVGLVLAIVGGFLMYHAYQAFQTFGAKFNHAVGYDAGNREIAIQLIVGLVLALAGAALFFKDEKEKWW